MLVAGVRLNSFRHFFCAPDIFKFCLLFGKRKLEAWHL